MPEVVWIIRTLFSQGKSHRSAGSTGRLQEPLVSSRSRNLQRFGMEKVSRVESLQEIIAEMSDGEENPATTRSQPLLLPTHAATEIHSAQDGAGLSETRHKQRERCAWSPSRRGRCESDRGAPDIAQRLNPCRKEIYNSRLLEQSGIYIIPICSIISTGLRFSCLTPLSWKSSCADQ